MATVVTYSGGLRRIEFGFSPKENRRILRLGRVSQRVAGGVLAKVEAIVADRLMGRPHDAEVAKWLGGLDETMLARLRAVGLADGVGVADTTLGAFLERYFRALTCKPQTRVFYRHTRRCLEGCFGASRPLRSITAADADTWRAWLVEHEDLAGATVARRIVAARSMWKMAVRWRLASENIWAGIKGGHQSNDARKLFIPASVIETVIAEAPDTEWKVIIALARYGGLRTPSEHFALRWGDIDWERGTIRVTCPKLAHFERFAHRTIPLFPELRKHLLALFEEAEPGAEHVIVKNRLACGNLRQQFERIIARAGLTQWPRLFHNLRGSRETELMRQYDLATVCRWIGNSPEIAARHYATSIDLNDDFRRAVGAPNEAQRNAQCSASTGGAQPLPASHPNRENDTENAGGEPLATAGEGGVWARQDSNLRPDDYESPALTAELRARVHASR